MINSANLFTLTLLATGGLYACMLVYFNGLVGSKRSNTQIMWNSEPVLWIITLALIMSVVFRLVEPAGGTQGPGIWYLIGTGNLMVVYIYLIMELARHDLPKVGYWLMAALTTAAIIYLVANIAMALFSQSLDLALYRKELAFLMAAMTHILLLVLVFNFLRSIRSSLMKIWFANPNSPERLTAGGIAVTYEGEVSNANGALWDISLEPGAKPESESAILQPKSCIVVDFGIRRIEDHGFRSDLRIMSSNTDQIIGVEVSNDKQNWVACEREDKILTDWDVPYFDSPWRYVRVCNVSDEPVRIGEVYDLD